MRSIRHKTLFAAAFVFAAGFAGSAMAGVSCYDCQRIYQYCMNEAGTTQSQCAQRHNACAQPIRCPLMPVREIE